MYYLIYKITNKLNGKIYIGQHKTENKDDGYMGSGRLLKEDEEKYGLENFEKTILFECSSFEEMNQKEQELVNEEFVKRDDTYNLCRGGGCDWDYINMFIYTPEKRKAVMNIVNSNPESIEKRRISFKKYFEEFKQNHPEEYKLYVDSISEGIKKHKHEHPEWMKGENNGMYGKHHSEKTKEKLSETHVGSKNSQYGKHWYTNPTTGESKSFLESEVPEGWVLGRTIPKMKGVSPYSKGKLLVEDQNGKTHYIKPEELETYISMGYKKGTTTLTDEQKQRIGEKSKLRWQNKKEQLHKEKYAELKPLYDLFIDQGFEAVVKQFNYKYTRNNLIIAFKAYIPEYVPAKCNRWKNSSKSVG